MVSMDVWSKARVLIRTKSEWRRQASGRRLVQLPSGENEALLGDASGAKGAHYVREPWWRGDLQAVKGFLSNWVHLLLVAVPLGILAGALKWNSVYVFCLNFLALIPLALLLGDVTEDLALRYGSVIGGLINATFGNIVEIILSIAALFHGLYIVVAASLLGSILSNLLLVTGCSFFFGGLYNKTQNFNPAGTQASSSLLFLAALAFLIPTGAGLMFSLENPDDVDKMVLHISRGTAVVLLLCYGCYLYFQLRTHVDLFQDDANGGGNGGHRGNGEGDCENAGGCGSGSGSGSGGRNGVESSESSHADEEPELSLITSMLLLATITVTVAVASEYLTASLEQFSKRSGLGEAFLGTIVLPIAGNACEHMTAVIVATKNKMDLSMSVAIGSSIQVALFAVPLAVVVGWISGHPFSLSFDPFAAMALMLSVAQVNFVTAGATSNWLLGVQLMALYVLLSLAFYFK
ncbi:hypothetical protein Vretimale_15946 [Volvox reticuliferus]|uniref:Sodium/calcium exchanger membrane region domain-containing protein n=1 Tax=Volvox reticuliferus TaxID=1737510 RepID=A0A8J4LVJ9_9CHLO|nr:hypothetical protein Vretifemale_13007 [Volvox reticuliferus]GIM12634.1 hypothetical protein Vretimale_15946 [Volvox reticuliferus]